MLTSLKTRRANRLSTIASSLCQHDLRPAGRSNHRSSGQKLSLTRLSAKADWGETLQLAAEKQQGRVRACAAALNFIQSKIA